MWGNRVIMKQGMWGCFLVGRLAITPFHGIQRHEILCGLCQRFFSGGLLDGSVIDISVHVPFRCNEGVRVVHRGQK
jgi:hypothetical protein